MPNPLQQAIKSGVKTNDSIGGLFARIGTSDHPHGFVKSAYRNAKRSMTSARQESDPFRASGEVMIALRKSVLNDARSMFEDAQLTGAEEAARQLRFYGTRTPHPSTVSMALSRESQSALDVISARLDVQETAIQALLLTTGDASQILGDENRNGVLTDAEIAAALAFWTTALLWDAFGGWTNQYGGDVYQKIAVAAIDGRTTDCCLRVHGQTQPFDTPFHLTGTPRFADYMDWPGFHYYCRTAGALYLSAYDTGLTTQMRSSADYFIAERKAGRHPDRHPANAF